MNDLLRYVFDANTLISALLFEQSTPGRAFYAALARGTILTSREVVKELSDVLARPKFDRFVTPEEREQFLELLVRESTLVEVTTVIQAGRDPKDDKYLALAVDGRATCLVSGDQDLLVLHPFQGIPILSPADFLASLAGDAETTI